MNTVSGAARKAKSGARPGQLDGRFVVGVSKRELLGKYDAVFEPSDVGLRHDVRVGGLESDLHRLPPMMQLFTTLKWCIKDESW